MMNFKFNGHELVLFDSIQELPIDRFQMYNLNLMLDAGIGSDLNAYNKHVNMIVQFINAGDKESAVKQLRNKQQSVHFIINKNSPEYSSFVALIYSIDGKELTEKDLTDEGVKKIIDQLGKKRFSIGNLRSLFKSIKKKIEFETDQFFPKLVNHSSAKELISKLKIRTNFVLENIINQTDKFTQQIKEIDAYLLSVSKPNVYSGSNGLEVGMIRNFEQTCNLLEFHNLSSAPKKLTTLSFLEKTIALKELIKKMKKKK